MALSLLQLIVSPCKETIVQPLCEKSMCGGPGTNVLYQEESCNENQNQISRAVFNMQKRSYLYIAEITLKACFNV